MTHTFATLGISSLAYTEIAERLKNAGLGHRVFENFLDLSGIALAEDKTARIDYAAVSSQPALTKARALVLYCASEEDREEVITAFKAAMPRATTVKL